MPTDNEPFGRSNRFTGVLTQGDKDVLYDDDDSTREARHRLRERAKQGIRDFSAMATEMEDTDLSQVFESIIDENPGHLSRLIALLYLGVEHKEAQRTNSIEVSERFGRLIESGVQLAAQRQGKLYEPEVELNLNEAEVDPPELIEEMIKSGGTVSEYRYIISQNYEKQLLESIVDSGERVIITDQNSGTKVDMTPLEAEQLLESEY